MVPLLLKTNIQAGQATPLTNEGVRFFQCWFKIGCKLICNAWEGQSVCRGNNFTLLGIGEIPITVEVGWNQSSAVQPTTSVIAISVRNRDQRVAVFNFGTDRVRVLEKTSGSGSGTDRVRVLALHFYRSGIIGY